MKPGDDRLTCARCGPAVHLVPMTPTFLRCWICAFVVILDAASSEGMEGDQ